MTTLDHCAQRVAELSRPVAVLGGQVVCQICFHDQAVLIDCIVEHARQSDLIDVLTERLDQLRKCVLRIRIGLRPDRRLYPGESRGQGRFLRQHFLQPWGRARTCVRVTLVVPDQLRRQQRDILQRPRKQSNLIQHLRQLQHAAARDPAVARLEAVDAAISGGPDDRAVRLAAQRQRHHACRDRRGGAAR